jgi:hypothetical protein
MLRTGGLVPSTRRLAGRLEHQRTLDAGVLWYGMGESKVTKILAASALLVLFRALFGLFSLGSQRQLVGYRDGFHQGLFVPWIASRRSSPLSGFDFLLSVLVCFFNDYLRVSFLFCF